MPDTSNNRPGVVVMGTIDTKAAALVYLAERVAAAGCRVLLIDTGVGARPNLLTDLPGPIISPASASESGVLYALPRGEAVERMSRLAASKLTELVASGQACGVVGLGGSGGTTICAAAMRALPYGVPKLLVSTLASGNTRWHIDISDIVMMPSILDIAGLNPMLQMVLNNAAWAISGMVKGYTPYAPSGKEVVGVTMYGTTTRGVSHAADLVSEAGFETWVFHASGVGGRTMEKLIRLGLIHGVMDMTLAEIGAHLVGGLHDGGPNRLEAAGDLALPQVIVPGAADTIVLPPRDQVPDRFRGRTLNFHNPTMTTMRTTASENVAIGNFIASKLNRAKGPVSVVLPRGGLSSIDRPGQIFYDPEANAALFDTLKSALAPTIRLIEDDRHIDDPEFAARVAGIMVSLMKMHTPGLKGSREDATVYSPAGSA